MTKHKKSNYTSKTNLLGDPLYYDRLTYLWSLVRREETYALAGTVALFFGLAQAEIVMNTSNIGMASAFALFNTLTQRATNKDILNFADIASDKIDKYAIDKNPPPDAPPTVDRWGPTASRAKRTFSTSLLSPVLAIGIVCTLNAVIDGSNPLQYCLPIIPMISARLRGMYRWHKIEVGDWRIDDKGPTPEKVFSRVAKKISAAAESLAPNPALQPSGALNYTRATKPMSFPQRRVIRSFCPATL